MLILDLDNTIFKTNTINPKTFEPILEVIRSYYQSINKAELANQVIEELWSKPIDIVFEKYDIPKEVGSQVHNLLNETEYDLEIRTYPDYEFLKRLKIDKILVTTGFEKLQLAKIESLKIKSDFTDIFIDDPLGNDRKYKIGIFREILNRSGKKAADFWIIGDSVDNEIIAGKELGMKTIQRLENRINKSQVSDYAIESFEELDEIIGTVQK